MDRETIIKLAREAGFSTGKRSDHIYGFDRDGDYTEELEDFAKLVAEHAIKSAPDYKMGYADGVAAEREACAKVAEWTPDAIGTSQKIAAAIRARGNT